MRPVDNELLDISDLSALKDFFLARYSIGSLAVLPGAYYLWRIIITLQRVLSAETIALTHFLSESMIVFSSGDSDDKSKLFTSVSQADDMGEIIFNTGWSVEGRHYPNRIFRYCSHHFGHDHPVGSIPSSCLLDDLSGYYCDLTEYGVIFSGEMRSLMGVKILDDFALGLSLPQTGLSPAAIYSVFHAITYFLAKLTEDAGPEEMLLPLSIDLIGLNLKKLHIKQLQVRLVKSKDKLKAVLYNESMLPVLSVDMRLIKKSLSAVLADFTHSCDALSCIELAACVEKIKRVLSGQCKSESSLLAAKAAVIYLSASKLFSNIPRVEVS